MKEFTIIEQLEEKHIEQLYDMFQSMWSSEGRTKEEISALLNVSMSFGVINNTTQNLVAYARVLTDKIKYAFIFDVMAIEQYRGRGLGRLLLEAVIAHPKLKNIKIFELTCAPDKITFYEKFGFNEDYENVRPMRYIRKNR